MISLLHQKIMSAITGHVASPFLFYSPPKLQNSGVRFSRFTSKSHGDQMGFTDFPYLSASHRDLMVDLASIVETRLDSSLNPCGLPSDIISYGNETGTAHATLHLRTGVHSSPIDFILGSCLHCELPSGGALNITSMLAYLNSSTDAPNFVVELIRNSPTSMILMLDLPPRQDIMLNPDYLKTFYEDTRLDKHRQRFEKLTGVTPHVLSSLYSRSFFSPTAIVVRIQTEELDEMIKTDVNPIAKELLNIWLDLGPFGERVVCESERGYLKKRDRLTRQNTIEMDLSLSLPQMFGPETANRVLQALRDVF